MYQEMIKSPAWEIERMNRDNVQFSARNSGLADFITIPRSIVPDPPKALRKGILVKCDSEGRFVSKLDTYDPNLSLHG